MVELLTYAVCVVGIEEEIDVMGTGEESMQCYRVKAQTGQLRRTVAKAGRGVLNVMVVCSPIRVSTSAKEKLWSGGCHDSCTGYLSASHRPRKLVAREGAGDAFAAGVNYAEYDGTEISDGSELPTGAGGLKRPTEGDSLMAGVTEVWEFFHRNERGSRSKR